MKLVIAKIIIIVFFLSFLTITSYAQLETSEKVVNIKTYLSHDKIPQNSLFEVAIVIDVKEGMHIIAGGEKLEMYESTELILENIEGFSYQLPSYPLPARRVSIDKDNIPIYEGKVFLGVSIKSTDKAPIGKNVFKWKLHVQGCTEVACFAPADVNIEIPFEVVPPNTSVNKINEDIISQIGQSENEISKIIRENGWFVAYLFIFILGLGLCVTPCVYPIIPVTISYFGKQSSGKMSQTLLRSVLYVVGLAIVYSLLGTVSALAGGLFGALLSYWYVKIGISVILVLFAMSLFGLYEVQLPASINDKIGGSRGGVLGALFMGGAMGIVAAPCVFGIVASVLFYVAQTQNPLIGFTMMFTLSLGLGLPFLVLGMFSGTLHKLPKSGSWMNGMKKIFGFILIYVALYYASSMVSEYVYNIILICYLLLVFIYEVFIEKIAPKIKWFKIFRIAFGIASLIWGIFISYELFFPKTGINWTAYSDQIIEKSKADKKPVIIDFTADWCQKCKEIDKEIFHDSDVVKLSKDYVTLRVDLSNKENNLMLKKIEEAYAIKGLPTIVFLDNTGTEKKELRVAGKSATLDIKEFLNRMKLAKKQ